MRRKILYKVDRKRAIELSVDAHSWNQTNSTTRSVQDGVTLPQKLNHTKIVKVVLAEGIVGDRIVPPSTVDQDVLPLPGETAAMEGDVPYYDSMYEGDKMDNQKDHQMDEDMIDLSQSQDINIRGKVSSP